MLTAAVHAHATAWSGGWPLARRSAGQPAEQERRCPAARRTGSAQESRRNAALAAVVEVLLRRIGAATLAKARRDRLTATWRGCAASTSFSAASRRALERQQVYRSRIQQRVRDVSTLANAFGALGGTVLDCSNGGHLHYPVEPTSGGGEHARKPLAYSCCRWRPPGRLNFGPAAQLRSDWALTGRGAGGAGE